MAYIFTLRVRFYKSAFSRAAETDRLSDKKDHVMTFVAELYSNNFYTWKRVEATESRSNRIER